MTRTALTLALIALGSTASAGAQLAAMDRNGDRFVSFAELSASMPDLSRSDFRSIDANGDRRLSTAELNASGIPAVIARKNTATEHGQAAALSLAAARTADIDQDGNGAVSFSELLTFDAPALSPRHGN